MARATDKSLQDAEQATPRGGPVRRTALAPHSLPDPAPAAAATDERDQVCTCTDEQLSAPGASLVYRDTDTYRCAVCWLPLSGEDMAVEGIQGWLV